MIKKTLFVLGLILQANVSYSQDIILTNDDIISKEESVQFALIEEAPIFPGCEDVENDKRMKCFQLKMTEHIKKNFTYPRKAMRKNIKGKIVAMFIINKEGAIEKITARTLSACDDCEILEREAIRIISKLPKMTPGKQKGKPVKVKYSQPFSFKLQ